MEQKEFEKLLSKIEKDCFDAIKQWVRENWSRPITDPFDKYYQYGGKKTELDILMDYDEDETVKRLEQTIKSAIEMFIIEEDNENVDIHANKLHEEIEAAFKEGNNG